MQAFVNQGFMVWQEARSELMMVAREALLLRKTRKCLHLVASN
jgi:hypothetical protein